MSMPGGPGPLEVPAPFPPADVRVSSYEQAMRHLSLFARQHVNAWPTTTEQLDGAMDGVREALYTFMLARGALQVDPLAVSNKLIYRQAITLDEHDVIRRSPELAAKLSATHALYYGVTDLSIATGRRIEDPRYGLRLYTGLLHPDGAKRGLTLGETALITRKDGVMFKFDPSESPVDRKSFYIVSRCILHYLTAAAAGSPPLSLAGMLGRLQADH